MTACINSSWIVLAIMGIPLLAVLIWMIYLGVDAYKNNR